MKIEGIILVNSSDSFIQVVPETSKIIAAISVIWFHESLTLIKIISMSFIIIGIIGLNLAE